MKKGNPVFFILFVLSVIIISEVSLNSCASRATPSGGPRDSIAPALDTSFPPNYSLFFNAREIELIFDEYLTLKDPNRQIMISPLQAEKPDILLKGKSILITLNDSLEENTTYTISFGTSITDYTEGNVNKGFRYVFSTGSYIDSLSLSGNIKDSYTDDPSPEMLVALYEILPNDTIPGDSVPFQRMPNYYAYTDESGNFTMENLRSSKFRLIAFEDSRNNFKLVTGQEKMAFTDSAIQTSDSTAPILLRSFSPARSYKFLGARNTGAGKIQFNFNKPVPDIKIANLSQGNTDSAGIYLFNSKMDTLYHWFEGERDSSRFVISGYDGIADTADVYIRKYDPPTLKLSNDRESLRSMDTIKFRSNLPVRKVDTSKFFAYTATDSFRLQNLASGDPRELYFWPVKRPSDYTIQMKEGAVEAYFDAQNDSVQFRIKSLKKEDLGNLDFSVTADSGYIYILEIYDATQDKKVQKSFTGKTTVELHNYLPGKYSALLIRDTDSNDRWTTGDYFLKRQAEKVIEYTEPIEVRANWDLELEWKIKVASKEGQKDPDRSEN